MSGPALRAWGRRGWRFPSLCPMVNDVFLDEFKNTSGRDRPAGIKVQDQQEVAQFSAFENAVEECYVANGRLCDCHYVMNASGKEYFQGSWID